MNGLTTVCFFLLGAESMLLAQSTPVLGATEKVRRGANRSFYVEVAAQGPRYGTPGKERLVLLANLEIEGNAVPVALVRDIQGRVRLETTGPVRKTLVFNGQQSLRSGEAAKYDDDLLEFLVGDSLEGLVSRAASGASVRLVGRHFGVQGYPSIPFGTDSCDVFISHQVAKERSDSPRRTKFYYFDSNTHDLKLVRYQASADGRDAEMVTIYQRWERVDGIPVPADVEKRVDGNSTIRLRVTTAHFEPDKEDGVLQ